MICGTANELARFVLVRKTVAAETDIFPILSSIGWPRHTVVTVATDTTKGTCMMSRSFPAQGFLVVWILVTRQGHLIDAQSPLLIACPSSVHVVTRKNMCGVIPLQDATTSHGHCSISINGQSCSDTLSRTLNGHEAPPDRRCAR